MLLIKRIILSLFAFCAACSLTTLSTNWLSEGRCISLTLFFLERKLNFTLPLGRTPHVLFTASFCVPASVEGAGILNVPLDFDCDKFKDSCNASRMPASMVSANFLSSSVTSIFLAQGAWSSSSSSAVSSTNSSTRPSSSSS